MRTVAVVLAGGSGSRFGAAEPKQLQLLAERNLLEHCVLAFDQAPGVDQVLVVVAAGIAEQIRGELSGYGKVCAVIHGGATRTDSTRQAIRWLQAEQAGRDCKVLFHDAARPLVEQRIIADCIASLDQWQALGVVVPSADTVVEVSAGQLQRVLPRDTLGRCQTPQGFLLSVIGRAYQLADADPGFTSAGTTDDCGVVLRYLPQVPVGVVRGSERNLKVTYPADLAIAHALLDLADAGRAEDGWAQRLGRAEDG